MKTLPNVWKTRKVPIILSLAFLMLASLSISKIVTFYSTTYQTAQAAIATEKMGIVEDIARTLDTEAYKRFLADGYPRNGDYEAIHRFLRDYQQKTRAMSIYTLTFDGTPVSKVLIVVTPPGTVEPPFLYPCTVPAKQVYEVQAGHTYYTDVLEDKDFGHYLSVGAPIYDTDGTFLGAIGMDISSETLDQIAGQVVRQNSLSFILDLLIDALLIIGIYYTGTWYQRQLQQGRREAEDVYMKEFSQLIASIRSNRHDLANHIQVVKGLMDIRRYEQAHRYLDSVAGEFRLVHLSLTVKHPALLILVNSKEEQARTRNVKLELDLDEGSYDRIDSIDLIKLLSNMLDNAIDACQAVDQDRRFIRLSCKEIGSRYVFTVENSAALTEEQAEKLFTSEFTTKTSEDPSVKRGQGLQIIRHTVAKYDGELYHSYEQGRLLVQVIVKAG